MSTPQANHESQRSSARALATPVGEMPGTLGTFGGVLTPSILTILGLVLFLRVAYVVGSVGLVKAMVILALATSVSVLTSISLSVVATNMRVRGGGEYFLISRTLGIEFGGAVGVVLYLAISVSIAFYAIGFAEALVTAFGDDRARIVQLVAAALVVLLAAVAFVGADLATRLQYVVMALLVLAIGSFLVGAIGSFSTSQLGDNLTSPNSDVGFWEAFAIFFPAVTGFSQGLAMSGDLKTPSRSITRGTFAAVGISTVVYVVVIVLLAGNASAAVLAGETTTIMGDLSAIQWTMIVGVLAATLSSALASALGGPRVLQRLGEDRVLPRLEIFAVGAGVLNNPRRALGLSVIIALITVAAGDINAISPVISMFFLATYGVINYATYFEIRAGGTSFRPTFRWFDHRASLLGTAACAGAIIAINPIAGALAGLILVALYSYLSRRDVGDRWVDSSGSHHYTQARNHLHSLALEPTGSRDWRPVVLTFVPRDPLTRRHLVTVATWLEGNSGFVTAVRLVDGAGPIARHSAHEIEFDLAEEVHEIHPGTYAKVLAVEDPATAVQVLVQSHGIGSVRANLSVFGVRDLRGSDDERAQYGEMLQNCVRSGTNVAVVNTRSDAWDRFEQTPRKSRTIAVWWSDDKAGQLLTLLGWLCQRHDDWDDATMIVYIPDSEHPNEVERVSNLVKSSRIDAEVVAVDATPASFITAMSGASFALAPLRVRRGVAVGPFDTSLGMIVESLPLSALILATEELDIGAQPDVENLAELERARVSAEEMAVHVAELDAEAGRLLVMVEAVRMQLDAEERPAEREVLLAEKAVAQEAASAAYRAYVDAKVRHYARQERVEQLAQDHVQEELDPSVWQRPAEPPEDQKS